MTNLRSELRRALPAAMKAKDVVTVRAVRSALSAIDNAESVDLSAAPKEQPGKIAGGVAGLGAGEVPRQTVSEEQIVQIVRQEIAEREAAAHEYERGGFEEDATRIRAEAAALTAFVD